MPYKLYKTRLIILLAVIYTGLCIDVSGQIADEIKSKLPFIEQAKIQHAAELYKKASRTEEDAKFLISKSNSTDNTKAEKKYLDKRTEASDQYKEANKFEMNTYTENIKTYIKKLAANPSQQAELKFAEKTALDSFKRAGELRSQLKKVTRLIDKVALMEKAEVSEKEAILLSQKVLLACLNWPTPYDANTLKVGTPKLNNETKPEVPEVKDTATIKDFKSSSKYSSQNSNIDTVLEPQVLIPVKTSTSVVNIASALPPNVPYTTHSKDRKEPAIDSLKKEKQIILTKDSGKVQPTVAKNNLTARPTKSKYQTNDSSLYGKANIDESQIDKFNTFLKTTYPQDYEHYIIDFQSLNYADVDQVRQAWDAYLYGYKSVDSSYFRKSSASIANSLKADSTQHLASLTNSDTLKILDNELSSNTLFNRSKSLNDETRVVQFSNREKDNDLPLSQDSIMNPTETLPTKRENEFINTDNARVVQTKNAGKVKVKPEIVINNDIPVSSAPFPEIRQDTIKVLRDGFVFRVQVVCCKVKLDEKALKGIYAGNELIIETYEDGWYKYTVGAFSTYREAKQFKKNSEIPGAFVVSYVNEKRIKITPAIAFGKPSSQVRDVSFRIQIAASKIQLSDKYLINIYNGSSKIMVIIENGWHKYSIDGGKTINEAQNLLKEVAVPGAFIVAYRGKQKLDLRTAIRTTNK